MTSPKRIGFLSFGAWHPGGGLTHTGGDALRQTVELAVAAEEIGIDGAFVRVHHFARQLSSPFPLLAAIGVKTSRIEIGTGVIDMRYESPLYMAETAAAADLLADGRLQLGVSRGSPEPAWHGAAAFGYSVDPDEARDKTPPFRAALPGAAVLPAGAGGRRGAWRCAPHARAPPVPVGRSVIPISSDPDRRPFGADANEDQVGWLDGAISRFGRSYTGEPDQIADDPAKDAAVQAADTVLLTVPSQLGVDYNAPILETIPPHIAPAPASSPQNLPHP